MKELTSHSVLETMRIAKEFAARLRRGDKVALCGELGSGKTHFAKGVIAALTGQAEEAITSPTFTLIEEYPGEPSLYHLDLYRLNRPEELRELDQDVLFGSEGVTLIEWADRFPSVLELCHYRIFFRKVSQLERHLEIHEAPRRSPE